ncbi:MAG: sigma factor-like helix-turn-helix DNA-binding protein, partial [Patescibacteria group bacterium]
MPKDKNKLTFKPKEVTKKLLSGLSDRANDILAKRYGLGKEPVRMTLEAIGGEYKITRERVRQIENFALNAIKKSDNYKKSQANFDELKKLMDDYGGVVHEEEFLGSISEDKSTQNHIHFLLVLSDTFYKLKEDEEFYHRWTTNQDLATKVHQSIRNLCQNFTANDLISESELVSKFLNELKTVVGDKQTEVFAKKWLSISKHLGKNPLGEWGLKKSPNVKMRGVRDYAYLVIRQNGSPMHFTEVAKAITNLFGKKAHPATCHNELIKDKRFVLVGRGLYALAEWGYTKGIVADVIRSILKKDGPLPKDEIVARVLKERHVKENTIL